MGIFYFSLAALILYDSAMRPLPLRSGLVRPVLLQKLFQVEVSELCRKTEVLKCSETEGKASLWTQFSRKKVYEECKARSQRSGLIFQSLAACSCSYMSIRPRVRR